MKISIVIPCFNAAKTIDDQLQALSRQACNQEWEVVVVNNDSTDNTMEIAHQYRNKFTNFITIDACEKKGPAYARNEGVKKANGEYVLFCDADDVVAENWLANMAETLVEHDFVACRMDWVRLNNFKDSTLEKKVQTEKLIDFSIGKFLQHGGGGTLGIKKNIHTQVNGFDETLPYLEDVDYCWRIQLKGYKLTFVPNATIYIRSRNTYADIFKQEMNWAEYDIYLYKKYYSHGMPEFSLKQSFRSLYHLFRAGQNFFSDEKKGIWITRLAIHLGRLKGVFKHKLSEYGLIKSKIN